MYITNIYAQLVDSNISIFQYLDMVFISNNNIAGRKLSQRRLLLADRCIMEKQDSHSFAVEGRTTVHLMSPFGPDWGAYTSASSPVFLRPLCHFKSANGVVSCETFK